MSFVFNSMFMVAHQPDALGFFHVRKISASLSFLRRPALVKATTPSINTDAFLPTVVPTGLLDCVRRLYRNSSQFEIIAMASDAAAAGHVT